MNKRWLSIALAMLLSCSAAFTTISINKQNSGGNNMEFEVPTPEIPDDGTGDTPGGDEELPPDIPDTPGEDDPEDPVIPIPPPEEEPDIDVDGVVALPYLADAMPSIDILGEIPEIGAVLKTVSAPTMDLAAQDTLYFAASVTAEELETALRAGVTARDGNGEALNVTLYKLDNAPYDATVAMQKDGKTRTVTLQATDRFGRTVSLKRDFHIVTSPEIIVDDSAFATEDGAIVLFLNEASSFDPAAGVSVLDPNGRLSETSLLIRGTVDVTAAGTYPIEYALDDGYNSTVTAKRTVVVRERNTKEIIVMYEELEETLRDSAFTSTKKGVIFNRYQPLWSYNFYTPFEQRIAYADQELQTETYLKNPNETHFANTARRAYYNFLTDENATQTTDDFTVSAGIGTDSATAVKPPSYQSGKMDWDGAFAANSWTGEITRNVDAAQFNEFAMTNVASDRYRMLLYALSDGSVKTAAYSLDPAAKTGSITFTFNIDAGAASEAVAQYARQLGEIYGYTPEDFYSSVVTVAFETDTKRITALDGYEEFKSGFHGNPDTKKGEAKLKFKQTFAYGDVTIDRFAAETQTPAVEPLSARARALKSEETASADSPAIVSEPLTLVKPTADTLYPWLYAGIDAGDAELFAIGIKAATADDFVALEETTDLAPFCAEGAYVVRYYAAQSDAYAIYDRPISVSDRIDSAIGAHYYHRTDRSVPDVPETESIMATPTADADVFVKLLSKGIEGDNIALYSITGSDGETGYFADADFNALNYANRADTYTVKYCATAANGNYTIFARTVTLSAKPQFDVDYSVYGAGETDQYQGVTRVILTPEDKTDDEAALRALYLRGVSVADPSDPELTLDNATFESTLDFSKEGTYYVRIKVANALGNEGTLTRYFYYKNPAPVVTVDNSVFRNIGEIKKAANGVEYVELRRDADFASIDLMSGVTAADELDADVSAAVIRISGELDASKLFVYQTITYSATNKNGATGSAYRTFYIRNFSVDELADSVAVYRQIAERMSTETYFQKSQGKTNAKTAFTNSSLNIYGTMDCTPDEMYFENVSSGDAVVGVNVSFAKRVYLKQNGSVWNGSFGAVEGQSATQQLIDSAWAYTYKSWSGDSTKDYTNSDFENDFGRPVSQLFCYPITAETLTSTTKDITEENGVYTMKLEINVNSAAATDGYKKQVTTISGQEVKTFNNASLVLTFDKNFRLLKYTVNEQYVVKTMSAVTTNAITYVNYFNPEGFRVRSF